MNLTWKEIDEERYHDMLGVVPPVVWNDVGFLLGEAENHRQCTECGKFMPVFKPFIERNGKFYEGTVAITVLEFQTIRNSAVLMPDRLP